MTMRAIIAASAAALVAACANGTPSPETCATAQLGLALAEANDLPSEIIARARTNIALLCSVAEADALEAEVEEDLGEPVELPAEVVPAEPMPEE